jgi:membrane-bound lytic murein transglycosylase D
MTDDERLEFVNQQEQRVSALLGDRPTKLNADAIEVLKKHVDHLVWLEEKKGADPLPVRYERAKPYLKTIGRSFKERNVPVIIGVYLAMIESAYQPCHEGPNGSKGLYQFLPRTAELYGVSRNEMCDAEKMTRAAAHYLADRMAELGDDSQSLTLVILSYTTGEGWVRNSLRQLRASGHYDRTFWTMFENKDSLDETFRTHTVNYVPAFFAAAIIGENPQVFGLSTPELTSLANDSSSSASQR